MDCVDSYVSFPNMDTYDEGRDQNGSGEQEEQLKNEYNAGLSTEVVEESTLTLEDKDTPIEEQDGQASSPGEASQSLEADLEEGELPDAEGGDDDDSDFDPNREYYDDIVDLAGGIESRGRYQTEMARFRTMDGEDALLYAENPRPLSPGEELYTLPRPPDLFPAEAEYPHHSSSDSDSDSDNDRETTKKKLRYGNAANTAPKLTAFNNPNAWTGNSEPRPSTSDTEFGVRAKELQSKRKRSNDVWVNVWANEAVQQAERELENFGVSENPNRIKIQRGPESFSIDVDPTDAPQRRKRRHQSAAKSDDMDNCEYYISSDSDEANTSQVSAEKALKRKGKQRLQDYLQPKSDEELKTFIVNTLRERNVTIIENAIALLGRDMTIKILSDTLKIQRNGGVLILNGTRKRTPGGVFINLIREDKSLDQDIVRHILYRNDGPPRKTRLGSRRRQQQEEEME